MARKKEKEIVLGEQCDINDHRSCDLKVSIGRAAELAEELNLPIYGKLQKIQERGVVSESEARIVLSQWSKEIESDPHATDEQHLWGSTVLDFLWPKKRSDHLGQETASRKR